MTLNSRLFIALLLPVLCRSASPVLQLYEAIEPHMGTLMRIKLYAPNEAAAKQGFRAAFDRIAQLDEILSDYNSASELNRLAAAAFVHPVHVSEDLARVVEASQQIAEQTNGAFDITVGPLTHLWRQARRDHIIPAPDAVQAAAARCGYQKLHLDRTNQTIKLDAPDMQLDVGGIAKGYAADEALAVLKNLGFRSALVAASGDLAFSDAPPNEHGWKIGIDSLDRADKPFTRVLFLSNAAVSTSGSTEQSLEINGKSYSHIIDPKTGMGLVDNMTVTTIARRGMQADAAATAVSVLGCEKGLAYVEREPDLAAFIVVKKHGQTRSFESNRFQRITSAH
jgi:thiamine biosynthesis lipoprotein